VVETTNGGGHAQRGEGETAHGGGQALGSLGDASNVGERVKYTDHDGQQPGTSRASGSMKRHNVFAELRPVPKKIFIESKMKKSRATSSRVLTSKKHLAVLQNEVRTSASKNSDLNKQQIKGKNKIPAKLPKKKLTCRLDKPRGRKPSSKKDAPLIRKPKGRKGDVFCAGCGEFEEDSTEPWIGCSLCKTW
jgi:hypothetical protein